MFFFFNDTATTEIYTLSLHDALPISRGCTPPRPPSTRQTPPTRSRTRRARERRSTARRFRPGCGRECRSEEHTSELQSRQYLVCRLLLEKKKNKQANYSIKTARLVQI